MKDTFQPACRFRQLTRHGKTACPSGVHIGDSEGTAVSQPHLAPGAREDGANLGVEVGIERALQRLLVDAIVVIEGGNADGGVRGGNDGGLRHGGRWRGGQ